MRYRAAARQAFVALHFANGVTTDTLAHALSMMFSPKHEQACWGITR